MPTAIDGNKILPKANSIGMEVHLQNFKIIPDVLGEIKLFNNRIQKNIPCIVEILVTHKVDEEKVGIIKRTGILAVEIDLSKSAATTKEELSKDIFNMDNWIIINDKIGNQYTRPIIPIMLIPIMPSYQQRRKRNWWL